MTELKSPELPLPVLTCDSASAGVPGPGRPSDPVHSGPVLPGQRLLSLLLHLHIILPGAILLPESSSSHFLHGGGGPGTSCLAAA